MAHTNIHRTTYKTMQCRRRLCIRASKCEQVKFWFFCSSSGNFYFFSLLNFLWKALLLAALATISSSTTSLAIILLLFFLCSWSLLFYLIYNATRAWRLATLSLSSVPTNGIHVAKIISNHSYSVDVKSEEKNNIFFDHKFDCYSPMWSRCVAIFLSFHEKYVDSRLSSSQHTKVKVLWPSKVSN